MQITQEKEEPEERFDVDHRLPLPELHKGSAGPRFVKIRGTSKPGDPAFASRPKIENSLEGPPSTWMMEAPEPLQSSEKRSLVEESLTSRSKLVRAHRTAPAGQAESNNMGDTWRPATSTAAQGDVSASASALGRASTASLIPNNNKFSETSSTYRKSASTLGLPSVAEHSATGFPAAKLQNLAARGSGENAAGLVEKSLASDSLLVYVRAANKSTSASRLSFSQGGGALSSSRPASRDDAQNELNRSRLRSAQAARIALQRASSLSDEGESDSTPLSTSPINVSGAGQRHLGLNQGKGRTSLSSSDEYQGVDDEFEYDDDEEEGSGEDDPAWHIFDGERREDGGAANVDSDDDGGGGRFRVHTPTKMERSELLFENRFEYEEDSGEEEGPNDEEEAEFLLGYKGYDPEMFSPRRPASANREQNEAGSADRPSKHRMRADRGKWDMPQVGGHSALAALRGKVSPRRSSHSLGSGDGRLLGRGAAEEQRVFTSPPRIKRERDYRMN